MNINNINIDKTIIINNINNKNKRNGKDNNREGNKDKEKNKREENAGSGFAEFDEENKPKIDILL